MLLFCSTNFPVCGFCSTMHFASGVFAWGICLDISADFFAYAAKLHSLWQETAVFSENSHLIERAAVKIA